MLLPRFLTALALPCFLVTHALATDTAVLPLLPAPSVLTVKATAPIPLPSALRLKISGPASPRIHVLVTQVLSLWSQAGGKPVVISDTAPFALELAYQTSPALPDLGVDESYSLTTSKDGVRLKASTDIGILRGLATLAQLPANGAGLPSVEISDAPRFAWRGLMLDVARHWQPYEVVARNLDAMALVKLNTLHLHLTEDQGFRVESKTHPELQAKGSDGHFFTQEQIKSLLQLANERGIRVIPEFDIPGHATSWLVSHPELASLPGEYSIERRWGVFDPVLDPSNEKTYALLADFLGEMAALFPDPILHIGGDENNGVQWNANPALQRFIRDHGLKDNAGLHAYFNRRVAEILTKNGKRLMGWDEILHPDLPANAIVHSWRGPTGLAEATRSGRDTVLSNGYYIDLAHPTEEHYLNDPIPEGTTLTPAEQKRVLGGEATMWAEWVTPETIDSRIWPRTAAIAERLWSPATVRDVANLHARLPYVSTQLTALGLSQQTGPDQRLQALFSNKPSVETLEAVKTVVAAVEPLKGYRRGAAQPENTQLQPLQTLADVAVPDSRTARVFAASLTQALVLLPEPKATSFGAVKDQLAVWKHASVATLRAPLAATRAAKELELKATQLKQLSDTGLLALASVESGTPASTEQLALAGRVLLDAAQIDPSATDFAMLDSLRLLVAASADPSLLKQPAGEPRRLALTSLIPAGTL